VESISIFGLGYVGTVTAACLAFRGHKIVGVDPNALKINRVREGLSPIVEARVQEMIKTAHREGLISATQDPVEAIANSDISYVTVGTPSGRNGKLDLTHVRNVCGEIGKALRSKARPHCIIVRSTVLPGTTDNVILPEIEQSSRKRAGHDFLLCYNPEFLREGTAVADFFDPPFTIIGTNEPAAAARVRNLYSFLPTRLYEVQFSAAEMIKYACNTFHAAKIAFANEVGTVCSEVGIDPKIVADIFKSDTRLNVSSAYLSPGFAFGGSCLPKDLRALLGFAKDLDIQLPLIESILPSNTQHINRATEAILELGKRRIGIIGLSFKAGTDDLRESPIVHLVKRLIAEGCDIQIWDNNVSLGRLIGSNREFIEVQIPHIGALLRDDIGSVTAHADVLVLGNNTVARDEILSSLGKDCYVFDVANLEYPLLASNGTITKVSGHKQHWRD